MQLRDEQPPTPAEQAVEQFTNKEEVTTEKLVFFMRKNIRKEIETVEKAQVTTALFKTTGLSRNEINKLWRAAQKLENEYAMKRDPKAGQKPPSVNEFSFLSMVEYTENRVKFANKNCPVLFDHGGRVTVIREDSEGVAYPHTHNESGLTHELNRLVPFMRAVNDDGLQRGVPCPKEVAAHLYQADHSKWLPELKTVTTCPHYVGAGRLIDTPGYDAETKSFFSPPAGFDWGDVPDAPTPEEVLAAKTILVDDVLGDFPLDGLDREGVLKCLDSEHEGSASVANAMAMLLLPFCREMISGSTPGHVITKPTPGTGAGYLAGVLGILATGNRAPALAFPADKNEVGKVLTSALSGDRKILFFDNIPAAMDSAPLALAMTERYSDRLLGGNRMVNIDVRAQWLFTANNIKMSPELIRRCMAIELDSGLAKPEERSGFKSGDILQFATENRGEIVNACLTLIQNWIAAGKPLYTGPALGNFTEWAETIGGILEAAGVKGFLANRDKFRSYAETTGDGSLQLFMNTLASHKDGTIFRPGGTSKLVKTSDINAHGYANAVSLLDVINGADDGNPLLIDGWGYSRGDAQYNTSKGISGPFGDAARRPWVCEIESDGGGDQTTTITFTSGKDKNGPFFVLHHGAEK